MTLKSTSEVGLDCPLQGVRVLELTQYIAGPFAGQQLADLGADVIKIERPGSGDPFRTYVGGKKVKNFGVNYRAYNRSKKSIVIDIQHPAAKEIILDLAAKADVVLENFREGVLDRLGIGYDVMRGVNPGLVFCSISGFSGDGPYRDRPAFDAVGQAISGMLYTSVDPENPRLRGPTLVDQATALQASNAVLGALFAKSRTGRGARIDISMVDASIGFIPDMHAFYTDAGVAYDSEMRSSISQAFIMRCSDDKMIAFQLGGSEPLWASLCEALGSPREILEDPRFATREIRARNWSDVIAALRPIFASQTRSYWERELEAKDIPYATVLTFPEVQKDPEVIHSGLFHTVEHPLAGPMVLLRRVARINGSRGPDQALPALLGEHTDSVMREIGYKEEQIAAFRSSGVFGRDDAQKV